MTRTNLLLATLAVALVAGTAFAYGPRSQDCVAPDGGPVASASRSQARQQIHEPGAHDPELATQTQAQQRLHRDDAGHADASGQANAYGPGDGQGQDRMNAQAHGRGGPRGARF